LAALALGTLVA